MIGEKMHKITYTYLHPENVLLALGYSSDDANVRGAFLMNAYDNGLIDSNTVHLDNKKLIHEVIWTSRNAWRAALTSNSEYTEWCDAMFNRIISAGGQVICSEQEVP